MPNLPSPDAMQIALTLGSAFLLYVAVFKALVPFAQKLHHGWVWLVGVAQTIGGRGPIIDKRTGREIAPAVPHLGEQIASINDNMAQLIEVVRSNQDAHHRIDGLDTRVGTVEQTVAVILADKYENAATAHLAAVERQNADAIDVEADE